MEVGGLIVWIMGILTAAGVFVIAYFNNATHLMKRVDELTTRIFKLQDEEAMCLKREADLKAEVISLSTRIRKLEELSGTVITILPGIIIADLNGKVLEYSPALSIFLRWTPREARGKLITDFIPKENHDKYLEAFRKAILHPESIDSTKEVLTYALAKGDIEVPVAITLYGWRTGNEGLITATIRQRASS